MANHADFAQRLKKACDANNSIPPYGRGQQVVIAKGVDVSQEAVRRWFEGESKPRPKLMTKLAKFLDVDEAWLSLGTDVEMSGREKRQYSKQAEASAYLVFGLFMAQGYSCAFAESGDHGVDFYAIKAGRQTSVSVTTGYSKVEGEYVLPVKSTYQQTINIVAVQREPGLFDMLYMDIEGVETHGKLKGDTMTITAKDGGRYITDGHEWTKLQDSAIL